MNSYQRKKEDLARAGAQIVELTATIESLAASMKRADEQLAAWIQAHKGLERVLLKTEQRADYWQSMVDRESKRRRR